MLQLVIKQDILLDKMIKNLVVPEVHLKMSNLNKSICYIRI